MTRPPLSGSLRRRSLLRAFGVAALRCVPLGSIGAALAGTAPRAAGAGPELSVFDISRDEDGVYLSYAVDFDLGRSVDDALMKSVPLSSSPRPRYFATAGTGAIGASRAPCAPGASSISR